MKFCLMNGSDLATLKIELTRQFNGIVEEEPEGVWLVGLVFQLEEQNAQNV